MSLPKPYYEDGHARIYHGDCLELIGELEFDVVVTDPPYGMAYRSSQGLATSVPIAGDESTDARDALLSALAGIPALVFGTWRVPRPVCDELLIWHKTGVGFSGNLKSPWGPCHEEIYVIRSSQFTGKRSPNVLTIKGLASGDANRPDHPTPKPVALMVALIEKCPDGVILDPFMGSGSTLRAAKDLGRKSIGIELEERYCEIAARRLAQEVLDFGNAA